MPHYSPFLIFVFLSALSAASRAASPEPSVITPRERVSLFNGRDLSSFTTWLAKLGTADQDRVFTVVDRIDGAPAIRISGQHYGGIITKDRYTDYRFVMEYRWGPVTWRPRAESTRDSGVLFHCQGEPGNNTPDFRAPWQRSIEYQIIEGGTGDLIIVGGYERGNPELLFPTLRATVTPGTRRWNPEGVEQEFGRGRNRTDWRLKDPAWKDVLGFRGANEAEKVPGQWNLLEATCAGRSLTYYLNGIKVNAATDASLREGRILIQSEGAELYVRRVELLPLTP